MEQFLSQRAKWSRRALKWEIRSLAPISGSVPQLCIKQEGCSCPWIGNGFIFTHWNTAVGQRPDFTSSPSTLQSHICRCRIWPLLLTSSRKETIETQSVPFFTDRRNKSQFEGLTISYQAKILTHSGQSAIWKEGPRGPLGVTGAHRCPLCISRACFSPQICIYSLSLSGNPKLHAWKTKPIFTFLSEHPPNHLHLLPFPVWGVWGGMGERKQLTLPPTTWLPKLETPKFMSPSAKKPHSPGDVTNTESTQFRVVTPQATRATVKLLGPAWQPRMGSPGLHHPSFPNCPRDKTGGDSTGLANPRWAQSETPHGSRVFRKYADKIRIWEWIRLCKKTPKFCKT